MATLTVTMSVFKMRSRYIRNAFFRARLFFSKIWEWFCENSEWRTPELRCFVWKLRMIFPFQKLFTNAPSKIENASSHLRTPFQRFLRMPLSRIENASHALRMLFQRIENASFVLRMIFSENWKCFSRFENAFLEDWKCFARFWEWFSQFSEV